MSEPSEGRAAFRQKSAEIGVAALFFLIGAIVIKDSVRLGFGWQEVHGPQPGYFPFYVGLIICIASVHGLLPARRSLTYEVGKSALANLCRQITVDFGPQGIRANAICPGGVQSRLEDDDPTPDTPQSRYTREVYPSRRLGWPRDIAYAALYFASDESTWVTGQVLAVDGGLVMM